MYACGSARNCDSARCRTACISARSIGIGTRPDPTTTDSAPDPIFQTPAWLLTQANLSPSTLKALDSYITARTGVYRLQVQGQFDNGTASRVEAVIDTNNSRPRIVYWRNLTELGKGFDLSQSGN